MSQQVDKWLIKGRKNCAKGKHWFIMNFGDYLLCPVCGEKKEVKDIFVTEYNAYLVNEMGFEKADCKKQRK